MYKNPSAPNGYNNPFSTKDLLLAVRLPKLSDTYVLNHSINEPVTFAPQLIQ